MKEAFITKRFTPETLAMITIVNSILDNYQRQGFRLSLRQLYYQLVARDLFPPGRKWSWNGRKWVRDPMGTINADPNYKWLGSIVSDGRQTGMVDWDMIEDRGRNTVGQNHQKKPSDAVRAASYTFHVDKWQGQEWHVEVMVEKDALSGILEPVCYRLDVNLTANKGYSSSSTMYEIGKRLERRAADGKKLCILYLGDHDPSGIDMTRDVDDRLKLYSNGEPIVVERLALNMDQVMRWRPPENPAKQTDARFAPYAREFGSASWELDAIEPRALAQLVESAILRRRDDAKWGAMVLREQNARKFLEKIADRMENKSNGSKN